MQLTTSKPLYQRNRDDDRGCTRCETLIQKNVPYVKMPDRYGYIDMHVTCYWDQCIENDSNCYVELNLTAAQMIQLRDSSASEALSSAFDSLATDGQGPTT